MKKISLAKYMLNIILILVLFFNIFFYTAVGNVNAQTNIYYISPDGDDDNPGTLEKPWGTLSGNAAKVQAGDTVYIRGGIYSGQTLDVVNSGTEDNYITYAAYKDEVPIISDSTAYGIKLRKTEYVII